MPKIHGPKSGLYIHDTYCRHFQALTPKHMSQIESTWKLTHLEYTCVTW